MNIWPVERQKNKLFWICDIQDHKQEDVRTDGDYCFNHIPRDDNSILIWRT
jgi:hypothetical protein